MFSCAYHSGMHIIIKFPLKPVSTNEAHRAIKRGRFPTVIKSATYRAFEKEVIKHIDFDKISALEAIYDRKRHIIQARIVCFNPSFYTKKKEISLTGGDVNHSKQIIDSIFKHTNLNDAFIKNVNEFQFPTDGDHRYEVHLHLQDLDKYLSLAN